MDKEDLIVKIKERIASEGPVTFETFMDMALYYPGLGYYMSGQERIGPAGDFYTSSHLHPVFGWALSLQINEMREILGRPDEFTIVEIGAGKGYLAEGITDYIHRELRWEGNWRYIIVERNPETMLHQQGVIDKTEGHIEWRSSIDELDEFVGCVISNELLDSFPVHLIEMYNGPHEVYLSWGKEGLREVKGAPGSTELSDYIERYRVPTIKSYRTEVNLRIKDLLRDITGKLPEGFIIMIDYGYPSWEYYAEERNRGTLICYYRHGISENPYENIGNQDITAHVNFTFLRDSAADLNVESIGYCPQGTFLISTGIDGLITEGLKTGTILQGEIPKIKGLLLGMGESHKVMVQYKGGRKIKSLKGFKLRNRINTL